MKKFKITLVGGHEIIIGVLDSDIELSFNRDNHLNGIHKMEDISDSTGMDVSPIDLLVKHVFNG